MNLEANLEIFRNRLLVDQESSKFFFFFFCQSHTTKPSFLHGRICHSCIYSEQMIKLSTFIATIYVTVSQPNNTNKFVMK